MSRILELTPEKELILKQMLTSCSFNAETTLTLRNLTPDIVSYRIRTTASTCFYVKPNKGILQPLSKEEVKIIAFLDNPKRSYSQYKFEIQSFRLPVDDDNVVERDTLDCCFQGPLCDMVNRMNKLDNNTHTQESSPALTSKDVTVPTNFGKHLLGCPSHNNLTLLAESEEAIGTNSVIMSTNSPVINRITTELFQTEVDMKEFSKAAVDCFAEGCYTGELESLSMDIFRHVYKISHCFQVIWMQEQCRAYFRKVVCVASEGEYSYTSLLSLFSEAEYEVVTMKESCLLDSMISGPLGQDATLKKRFIDEYAGDVEALSVSQLDLVCKLVGEDTDIIARILVRSVKEASDFSDNCRHIFKNVDLIKSFYDDPQLYDDFYEFLMSLEHLNKSDVKTVVSIQKNLFDRSQSAMNDSKFGA